MKFNFALSLFSFCGFALGGCASIYELDVPRDPTGLPTVKSIVQQIRCELAALASPNNADSILLTGKDFMVSVQLDLNVNDDGSLAPTFSYIHGLFSFNGGAKLEVSKTQDFTERLQFSLKSMQKEMKLASDLERSTGEELSPFGCPEQADTPLAGNLGLRETAKMALNSPDLNYGAKLSDGVFGGYVQFLITKNVNAVGPNWKLVHFTGPGNLAGLSQVNTDKLTFAFAEKNPRDQFASATAIAKADAFLSRIIASQTTSELARISSKLN